MSLPTDSLHAGDAEWPLTDDPDVGDVTDAVEAAESAAELPAETDLPTGARIRLLLITTSWTPFDVLLKSWAVHRDPDEFIVVAHQDFPGPPPREGFVARTLPLSPTQKGLIPWPERVRRFSEAVVADSGLHALFERAEDITVRDNLEAAFVKSLANASVEVPRLTPWPSVTHTIALRTAQRLLHRAQAAGADEHVLHGLQSEVDHLAEWRPSEPSTPSTP